MSYKYFIYGLNVESDICLEEAYVKEDFDKADVVIRLLSEMPDEITQKDDAGKDKINVLSKADAIWYRIPEVAEYMVEKDVISVLPLCDNPCASLLRTYLLGSSFGYCMLLRQKPLIHGGAVAVNNKGVIVTGDCGAGKSTVTNALLEKGYRFVADDTCAISDNEGKVHIDMAYPQQKLCRDAALRQGYSLDELIYIDENRDKFAVRLKDGFLPEGIDFDVMFYLKIDDGDELHCRRLTGQEALMAVMDNIYRGESGFMAWGVPPAYMKKCVTVASKIAIYEIVRPQGKDTLGDIVSYIEEVVGERR